MKQSIKNTIMIGMAVVLVGTSAVTISYAKGQNGTQPAFPQSQSQPFEQNSGEKAFENFGQNGNGQSSDNSNQKQMPGNQQGSGQQPQLPDNQQQGENQQPPQMPDNQQDDSSTQSESQDGGAVQKGTSTADGSADVVATSSESDSSSLNTAQHNLPPDGFSHRGNGGIISALCYMFAAVQIAIILAILAYLIISRFNRRSYNEVIANMRNNQ